MWRKKMSKVRDHVEKKRCRKKIINQLKIEKLVEKVQLIRWNVNVLDWPVTNKLPVSLKVKQYSLAGTHRLFTFYYASADLLLVVKTRTKVSALFLPAETPAVNCLSCRNVWTRHFICLLHLSGSLKMAEGSRHAMCLTVGYLRRLFSCTSLMMFDSPCMQSILNSRTLSSELLLLWKSDDMCCLHPDYSL